MAKTCKNCDGWGTVPGSGRNSGKVCGACNGDGTK